MDPKVCGKLLTTHGEAMVLMKKHSVEDPPSGGAPEQAPRWDLTGTEGCGGGIRVFSVASMFSGYMDIYRRKEGIGGARGGPRGWGARRARPGPSWPPPSFPRVYSKSFGQIQFQK